MSRFLQEFHDAMKPFCFRDSAHEHSSGPYRLPALMDVALLCEYSLRVRSLPWTLSVVEVRAPGDRWVSVDDRGVPT